MLDLGWWRPGPEALHQGDVVKNRDASLLQKRFGRRCKEILVARAKRVRLAEDCSLHDDGGVDVSNRGHQQRVEMNNLSRLAKEADVIVDATLRKTMERHHSRVAQNFGQFVEHLVGDQQNVFRLDESKQKVTCQTSCSVVRANENYSVENNSH